MKGMVGPDRVEEDALRSVEGLSVYRAVGIAL